MRPRHHVCLLSLMIATNLAGCGQSQTPTPEAPTQTPVANEAEVQATSSEPEGEFKAMDDKALAAQSFPDQWAYRARAAEHGSGEALGTIKTTTGEEWNVMRVGTLESWADELQLDQFVIRASRYMTEMSRATGHMYCGQICSAPNVASGGPWAVDILTQQAKSECAVVPVCSVPNGSGIKHYGQATDRAIFMTAHPLVIRDTQAGLARDFVLHSTDGKPVEVKVDPQKAQHYHMSTPFVLTLSGPGEQTRNVYDFRTNAPLSKEK